MRINMSTNMTNRTKWIFGNDWLLLLTIIGIFIFIFAQKPDAQDIVYLLLKSLLVLSVLAAVIHVGGIWWSRFVSWYKTSEHVGQENNNVDDTRVREQQSRSRDKLQEFNDEKVSDYSERILKPRQEAKKKDKEEEFLRFAGPAWKGVSHKLGTEQQDGGPPRSKEGSSREAASFRQLPDHVMNPPTPAPSPEKTKVKKKIVLPEEPEAGTMGSLTIILRTPQSRKNRRRFLQTQSIQVLLDYMTTLGYHYKLYTVCTSYPRVNLGNDPTRTLQDVGIIHDVTLNVEEKE